MYVAPENVISPKAYLKMVKVLLDGGPEGESYALVIWDGQPCIVTRWNGYDGQRIGNPQSRGLPTWFVLGRRLWEPLIDSLDHDLRVFARTFLNGNKKDAA